jgi:hypothetical protein
MSPSSFSIFNTGSYFDIIRGLSCAYYYAKLNEIDLNVEVVWLEQEIDDKFYFKGWEENESILEKFEYIHSLRDFMYDRKINFDHKIVSKSELNKVRREQTKFIHNFIKTKHPLEKWTRQENQIRPELDFKGIIWPLKNIHKRERGKLVLWRPTFNHDLQINKENSFGWHTHSHVWIKKALFQYEEWNAVISNLQENFNVVEIEYRTPIREIVYHLSTCEVAYGYSGLCQNLSVCLNTPTMMLDFKNSTNECYDHLIEERSVDLYSKKEYVQQHITIAKEKVKPFREWFEKVIGE